MSKDQKQTISNKIENNNKESKRMTSIARKINMSFWLKLFSFTILLDIVLLLLTAGTYFFWCERQLPAGSDVIKRYFQDAEFPHDFLYIIEIANGETYSYPFMEFVDYLILPAILLLTFEVIHLIFALFHTGSIRKKMRPLNELAIKAQQISNAPLDTTKFDHLEHAISNISPNASNIKVSTGDADLQSIEIALNNLLARMQESQKQQMRFVSDASHELRTPISVIQGYVNMLDRWGKEDESVLEESIEALKHESDHMKELIEQLLFLARGDSGRNTLRYSDFDLNEVIKEVWEESMMIDSEHPYIFEPTDPAMLHGDIAMIKQSVRIFVQNAAKYSSKGDTIKMAVKKDANTISYIIQDEGIGMQASEVVHIFERFYRSDEARNENTGGSGLGLSIAKWIIDAHDGTINVLSRPEIGTRFTITFPT